MKKLNILLLAALTLLTSACVGSSKNDNVVKREFGYTARTTGPGIDGVMLCQNTISLEVNYDEGTALARVTLALGGNKTVFFEVPRRQLTYDATVGASVLNASNITTSGGDVIDNFVLQWNTNTGAMLITTVVNGQYTSVGNTNLGYVNCKLHTLLDTDKEHDEGNRNDVQVAFNINSTNQRGIMTIYNFALGSAEDHTVNLTYSDLNCTITGDGFEFTAAEANPGIEYYKITNLRAVLSNQTRRLTITYKCNDYDVTITGNLFNAE